MVLICLALALCAGCFEIQSVLEGGKQPTTSPDTILDDSDNDSVTPSGGIVTPSEPSLSFSAGPVYCCNPLSVLFEAILANVGAGSDVRFNWDYGDGRVGRGPKLQHTFAAPGEYVVTLTASGPTWGPLIAQRILSITQFDGYVAIELLSLDGEPDGPTEPEIVSPDEPPIPTTVVTAEAGPDQVVWAGEQVQLSASGSLIPPNSAPTYAWVETSGYGITLSQSEAMTASFVAPQNITEPLELTFQLLVRVGDLWNRDTVHITVQPLSRTPEPVLSGGHPVRFLTGPKGASPPGRFNVTWRFVGLDRPTSVKLRRDCCSCQAILSGELTPDANDVFQTYVDVPADGSTIFYHVLFVMNGVAYMSQSIHVNTPRGEPDVPPAPVIWYHHWTHELSTLADVLASGVVTHVMIGAADRAALDFDSPFFLEAVDRCRQADVQIIWSRYLWNVHGDFGTFDDVFDAQYYIDAMRQTETEAAALGAQYTALDAEVYGESPMVPLMKEDFTVGELTTLQAAIDLASSVITVDFVYPAGMNGRPMSPINLYRGLAKWPIAESTYYDVPQTFCHINHPYDVVGVFVNPSTLHLSDGLAPYFEPLDVLERRFLWSAAHGAPLGVNGIFLYTDPDISRARAVARLLLTGAQP